MGKTVTKEKDKGFRKTLQAIRTAHGEPYVKVGVQSDAPEHQDVHGHTSPMQLIAAVHEFGAPSVGVPERSFIRSTMDEEESELSELSKKVSINVIDGKWTMEKGLGIIGLKIKSLIQGKITSITEPPLKEATIKAKGSSKPLIDSGQLRASITHEVVMEGDSQAAAGALKGEEAS